MSTLAELSSVVRTRRADMGLTQAALARLSGLSRATVNQLEAASLQDLSLVRVSRLLGVLGLSVTVAPQSTAGKTPALELAARSASVSYRQPLTAAVLRAALLQGRVSAAFQPHVATLLDEVSPALLAAVVEQLHAQEGVPRAEIWAQMRELARGFKSARGLWA
jgi:transcriptional regulator with XRE-family HTH domain